MGNDNYFKMYFKETDKIQEFNATISKEIKGELHIFEYNFTKADILKIILNLPEDIKAKIRTTFIQIDFRNGDINHFIDYILNGHIKLLSEMKIKEIEEYI